MSSHAERHGHLDVTTNREVVSCHACANEWYRDESGLRCPECYEEIMEVMDPENDPRGLGHHTSASTSPEHRPYDSDPEGADIREHILIEFASGRSARVGPDRHHDHHDLVDGPIEHEQFAGRNFGPRTLFRGRAISVTIVSGPIRATPAGPPEASQEKYARPLLQCSKRPGSLRVTSISMTIGANQRTSFFQNVSRDIGPPSFSENREGSESPRGAPAGLAQRLLDALTTASPLNRTYRDAVHFQEALDRLITDLMQANPQSNVAPPATEEALKNLERKLVDKELLGSEGKADCTICIDEMKEGKMVVFLPCNHWFHEECVTLWLKEHNTCPICRAPIEKTDRSGSNSGNGNNNSVDSSEPQEPNLGLSSNQASPFRMRASFMFISHQYETFHASPHAQSHQIRYSRPPNESQSRLNEALRNILAQQQERERERER
ncbi:hypothetical protein AU210_016395 [Fusarium oxysporum f. sp. radicis-cucumerinum]|uniref:RING-type E3 ubiquitin transferase n=1 Tax=Fusarium oxysporum f. sp. radicis-cucumerinum TaxID=327505 RepID=A0A2H3GAR4_FUSOX|nr:hypothetical protein AU210_016395 [Fusarium oxysporum f. sp. radicis-cucumerinum]